MSRTRFRRRFSGDSSTASRPAFNYTVMLSFTGNTGLQQRLQHAADGTISVRADQAQYEALNKTLNLQRHVIKANAIWDLPQMSTSGGAAHKVVAYIANGWQLSGIWTGVSGSRYDLAFSYRAASAPT